jgi:phosphatidylglycerophosphate synthase
VVRPAGSQEFVDDVLAELRAARWSPRGWMRMLVRSAQRSVLEARRRPLAAAEVTVLHAAVARTGSRGLGGRWAVVSWSLAITHLGLLGERTSLGWANRLSLMRALLPATGRPPAPWLAAVALATDWADGLVARAVESESTAFGFYGDALADAAFWTWFVMRQEPSRMVRAAALSAWSLPAVVVTTAYFTGGRSVDYPRPVLLRNASVALQLMVTARALRRALSPQPRHAIFPPPARL